MAIRFCVVLCCAPVLRFFKSPTRKFAGLAGIVFAAVSSFITYYWLLFPGLFGLDNRWSGTGPCFYFFILCQFLFYLLKTQIASVLCNAAAWTVYEYVKSVGYLGFPGHFPDDWRLLPCADRRYFRVWGLSFIVASVNAVIHEWFLKYHANPALDFSGKALHGKSFWALCFVHFNSFKPFTALHHCMQSGKRENRKQ